jgi:hypothetical protein
VELRRRGDDLGAKQKLNGAVLNGAVIFAGLAGLLTGSWAVFAVVLALMVGAAFVAGDLRR